MLKNGRNNGHMSSFECAEVKGITASQLPNDSYRKVMRKY